MKSSVETDSKGRKKVLNACEEPCSIEKGMRIIGGKWTGSIIYHLKDEPVRFNDLARMLGGASKKMIDQRLKEIDYGLWGGKSDEDIAATWGQTAIEDWRERNIAPTDAQWSPHPDTLRDNAIAFFDDLKTDHKSTSALVITSNGILRYFHPLFEGDNASPEEAKVKTGHWCVARRERTKVNPKCWNTTPDAKALIK